MLVEQIGFEDLDDTKTSVLVVAKKCDTNNCNNNVYTYSVVKSL